MKDKIKPGSKNMGSSFGFVMAAAGAAVGMGNIWRFPTLTGQSGGGAFVIVYLICIFVIGIPMLMAEIAIGRHSGRNAYESYHGISKKWGGVGILAIATSLVGLSYYTVLGGWLLRYIPAAVTGFTSDSAGFFGSFTASPGLQIIFYVVYMTVTAVIVMQGFTKGIEKACKVMMPILFVFLLLLAVRACTLPGAGEGIKFFLRPDFSKVTPGIWIAALGQVFFSLSVGAGAGTTYGAHLNKNASIPKAAVKIAGFDTLAALLAGLCILPAVFSAGMDPEMGPSLIFVVLPKVFGTMPAGRFFAVLFFVLVLFASITTTIAFLEVVVAFVEKAFSISRKKATVMSALAATALGIPSALSFGLLGDVKVFGRTFFELADYTVSNLCLPVSAILTCIFIGFIWKSKNAVREISNEGTHAASISKAWGFWIKFIIPILIILIFLYNR